MTWPEVGRFDRPESVCPDCGANDKQTGDRSISTRIEPIVDGELKLLVEAACPCGYEESFEIGSDG